MSTNDKQLNTLVSQAHKEALKRVAAVTYASEGAIIRDLIVFADQIAAGGCPPFPDWLKQAQDLALEGKGEAVPARPLPQAVKDQKEQEAFALSHGYSIRCQDAPCESCPGDCEDGLWEILIGEDDYQLTIGCSHPDSIWIAYVLAMSDIARPPVVVRPPHPSPLAPAAPPIISAEMPVPAARPAPPVAAPAQVSTPQTAPVSTRKDAEGKFWVDWNGHTLHIDPKVYRMINSGDKRNPALLALSYSLYLKPEELKPSDVERKFRYLFPEWADAFIKLDGQ